jgi:lipopolysaccharide transport system ATP-binding protein
MNTGIEFDHVWKKFARGERFDSLRDLIPSITNRLFSANQRTSLQKKEFWALQDVSFSVGRGDALGIIGPNGSGKSTTLKVLSGILRPDKGSLRVRGRLGALIELGAGFHPDLTGRENIYLNGTILGMKKTEIDAKFDEIVAFSELDAFLDTPVKRYSSGMHARLGFSVAVHVNPDVLVIDEVLSVGDYHFQQRCFEKMQEFVRRGTSLVFVSHNMTAVSTLCKSALVLRKGQAVFTGGVSQAIQAYHSFYESERLSEHVELVESRLIGRRGEVRDVFEPGETVAFEVTLKALRDVRDAHPGLMVHTTDGQCVFVTATSRLSNKRLHLDQGEHATVSFGLDLNLQGGVFLLGFTITPELERPGEWLYYNPNLKKIVMVDQQKAQGFVYMNPTAEIKMSEYMLTSDTA